MGLYAKIVQSPAYRQRKVATALEMLPDLLGTPTPPFDLRFTGPDGQEHASAHLLLVSNGRYELTRVEGFGSRRRIDAGILGIVTATFRSPADVALFIQLQAVGLARRFPGWTEWTDTSFEVGFCFDTCHAHAAGEELSAAVERVLSIVGRIDLLHANDSRDPPGTGADRHANLGQGTIGPETLSAMIGSAGPPVVVETPGGVDELRADIEFVRAALAG